MGTPPTFSTRQGSFFPVPLVMEIRFRCLNRHSQSTGLQLGLTSRPRQKGQKEFNMRILPYSFSGVPFPSPLARKRRIFIGALGSPPPLQSSVTRAPRPPSHQVRRCKRQKRNKTCTGACPPATVYFLDSSGSCSVDSVQDFPL